MDVIEEERQRVIAAAPKTDVRLQPEGLIRGIIDWFLHHKLVLGSLPFIFIGAGILLLLIAFLIHPIGQQSSREAIRKKIKDDYLKGVKQRRVVAWYAVWLLKSEKAQKEQPKQKSTAQNEESAHVHPYEVWFSKFDVNRTFRPAWLLGRKLPSKKEGQTVQNADHSRAETQ